MSRGFFRAQGADGAGALPDMSGSGNRPPDVSTTASAGGGAGAGADDAGDGAGASRARRPLPDQIGGYRIVREIGAGGMGVVYEAEQPGTRQRVALKVMRGSVPSESARRRFEFEAQALGRVQHTGVARILAADVDAEQPYLVMEYVDGRTLDEFVAAAGLDARGRLGLCAQIAEALHAAHQKGVVHRDVKPENIRVRPGGEPVLLDFGLALLTDPDPQAPTRVSQEGQVLGTYLYMSPEQARGRRDEIDTRSDVYSLGVVAYRLLSGELPYDLPRECAPYQLLDAIIHDDPRPLGRASSSAGLPARALRGDAELIVMKALEKDSARRFQSAEAFAMQVRRHLDGLPVEIGRPGVLYRTGKFVRRYRGPVIATAAVFAALVIGLGVALWQAGEARRQTVIAQAAEGDARRALAQSQLQTLRLAMQRGRWRQVLELSDTLAGGAVVLGVADSLSLGLARVEALDALDRAQEATAEAERLVARPDLGERTAEVQLWLGELYLTAPERRDEGLELIGRAAQGNLPPADAAYAQAFLAPTVPAAIAHLESAVAVDSFHLRARGLLGVAYLCAGQLDDAAIVLDATSGLFPEDTLTNLLVAVTAWLRREPERADRATARLLASLGPAERERLLPLTSAGRHIVELAHRAFDGEEINPFEIGVAVAPMLALFQVESTGDPGEDLTHLVGRMRQRLLPAIEDSWGRLGTKGVVPLTQQLMSGGGMNWPPEAIEDFGTAARVNPESITLLIFATARQSSMENAAATQADADRFFGAAAAPGVFRVQPLAFSLGIAHQLYAFQQAGRPVQADAESRRRIEELVAQRLSMGRWRMPVEAAGLAQALLNTGLFELAHTVAYTGTLRWPEHQYLADVERAARTALSSVSVKASAAQSAPSAP